jgi:hypothetical protein
VIWAQSGLASLQGVVKDPSGSTVANATGTASSGQTDVRTASVFNFRNPFVTTKPPYQRRQWEGEISGPLAKKTSFFLDFERRDTNENAFVNVVILDQNLNIAPLTEAVLTPLTGVEMNFKVDRQLSTNHTLTARYSIIAMLVITREPVDFLSHPAPTMYVAPRTLCSRGGRPRTGT